MKVVKGCSRLKEVHNYRLWYSDFDNDNYLAFIAKTKLSRGE